MNIHYFEYGVRYSIHMAIRNDVLWYEVQISVLISGKIYCTYEK